MNILTSFTLKTMKTYRKWTIVTVIGALLSTMLLTSVTTLAYSLLQMLISNEIEYAGRWTVCFNNVPEKDLSSLLEDLSPSQIGIIRELGFANLEGTSNKGKPYLMVSEFDANSLRMMGVDLVEGRLPATDREIVLPDEIRNTSGLSFSIGDRLSLDLGQRVMANGIAIWSNEYYGASYTYYDEVGQQITVGPEELRYIFSKEYTVVGFIETPVGEESWSAGYRGITIPSESGTATPSLAINLFSFIDNPDFLYDERITDIAYTYGYEDGTFYVNGEYLNLLGVFNYGGIANFIYSAVIFILLTVLFSSFFLIYNSFSISVAERTRHLGLLATAGATSKQLRSYVFREGMFVAFVGIPLGVGAGLATIAALLWFAEPMFLAAGDWSEMKLRLLVHPLLLAVICIVEMATLMLSSLLPAFRAAKIRPIEAVRQSMPAKRKFRMPHIWEHLSKPFGIEAVLATKSYYRNRSRYRATTISLVIGMLLFLTVSAYLDYEQMMLDSFGYSDNASISLMIDGISDAEQENIQKKILSIPDVDSAALIYQTYLNLYLPEERFTEIARTSSWDFEYLSLMLHIMNDEAFHDYALSQGVDPNLCLDPLNPGGIFINFVEEYDYEQMRIISGEVLDISPGEKLPISFMSMTYDYEHTFEDYADLPENQKQAFTAVAISHESPIGLEYQYFGSPTMVIPLSLYKGMAENADESVATNLYLPSIYIATDRSKDVEENIRTMLTTIPSSQVYLINMSTARESDEQVAVITKLLSFGFISLVSVICLANLINTVTTTTTLRRKEYAMLRSVGMSQKSFNRMIRLESIFVGLRVLIFGIPISIGLDLLLFYLQSYNNLFSFRIPVVQYVIVVVMIFVLIFATMSFSIAQIHRENIIDALKSDEE